MKMIVHLIVLYIESWNKRLQCINRWQKFFWCVNKKQIRLLDYAYFKENYRLIAVDLSKQIVLNADPRSIQQKQFQGVAGGADGTKIRLHIILEKSKETVLEFYKGTTKFMWII